MITAELAVVIAVLLALTLSIALRLQIRPMPNPLAIVLHASVAETASGTGVAVDLVDRTMVQIGLEVTVITGTTPTLAVVVEHSLTGIDWAQIAQFPAVTSASAKSLVVPDVMRFVRVSWAITGTTPSVSFSVKGTAHQLYCLPADIARYGLPAPALSDVPTSALADVCLGASDEAAGYLASAYTLPLVTWGIDLRKHVSCMVAYDLMRFRGYDPDSGKDELLQRGRDQAIAWLNRIADGRLRPPGILDTTPMITEVEVYVDSAASRGWIR